MFYGYKCFDKELINRYGTIFEVGKLYHSDNEIKFGNDGNGFHVCKRLEDTLRYFDAMNGEVDIAKVKCYGNYQKYEDEYTKHLSTQEDSLCHEFTKQRKSALKGRRRQEARRSPRRRRFSRSQ